MTADDRSTIFEGADAHTERARDHGGKRVAAALAEHGTEVLFALCGGHVLPVLDGCLDAGIRVVDARHEASAVMMAAGYAYATRRTGVSAITAGPGFTNAVTGIADANHSGVPVVVLGGRTPVRAWKRGAIQDVDQLALARPITTWAETCHAPERLEEYVAEAFWHARAGRPGAAYVELPIDVLMAEGAGGTDWSPGFPEESPRPQADPADVERAVRLLAEAERPILVAGGGAYWSGADEALVRFAEATGIPVTTTGPARGMIPDDHPGCLGGLVHGGVAVISADVIVVLGSRFDGNLLYGGPPLFQPHQRLIQVDVRAEAFGGNRAPDLALCGDATRVLDQLAAAWEAPREEAWLDEARDAARGSLASWDAKSEEAAEGVHTGRLARTVNAVAHDRGPATLVVDGGDVLTWGIAHFTAEAPGRLLTTGTALGTLGLGIPFAIGAKAARPDEPAIALVGDGTFGLSAMELDAAARADLPVVVVISNNGSWGDVQHEQRSWFGPDRLVASELGHSRYEKLAEMVDGFAATVDDPDELRPTLERAVDSGRVAVVNVRTDPTVVSEILRGIGQLGVM